MIAHALFCNRQPYQDLRRFLPKMRLSRTRQIGEPAGNQRGTKLVALHRQCEGCARSAVKRMLTTVFRVHESCNVVLQERSVRVRWVRTLYLFVATGDRDRGVRYEDRWTTTPTGQLRSDRAHCPAPSSRPSSLAALTGCWSLIKALTWICRTLSRVTLKTPPTSSRVYAYPSPRPYRSLMISRSR